MTTDEIIAYTDTLPLVWALWWFIENVQQGEHTAAFFHLRERVSMDAIS